MKTLLIVNAVGLSLAVIAIISLLILWFRAEKKLARHGESKIYVKEVKRK
jgi:hypothetical protein